MVDSTLDQRMPEWLARGLVPDEEIIEGLKTMEPLRYGMKWWRDLFSPRQRLGHAIAVEAFHQLVENCGGQGNVTELDAAALTYIALAMDKLLNYNSRMSIWMPTREVVANTFNRHDFAFCWSYSEMAPAVADMGYDWAIRETGKALEELIELLGHPPRTGESREPSLYAEAERPAEIPVAITCTPVTALATSPTLVSTQL